jgi:phage terminase large subunit GpA-like protein
MREFAEQEVVIPKGPFAKRLFSCDRQPYSAAWFELVDSGLWNRHFATGPTQSGKTFCCFVIPAMYHLFEVQDESVVLLAPKMEINRDKWFNDLLPAIQASKYKDQLPTKGPGSEGGFADSIRFKNGTTLKFMTGGGDDKNRASFTTRVVIVTEVDGMDTASETSRETDPITQTEARTLSHGKRKRIYGECTVSIETGRTWQEFTNGTQTRLAVRCHSCKSYVTPEREDLFGWQDADNVIEAREMTSFACPSCGVIWDDERRNAANRSLIAAHRGQEVVDGAAVGPLPQTDTLGFRWNAFNNLFWEIADIGADEWKASKASNPDNAEKEQLQFKWAKPYKPDLEASVSIDVKTICARANSIPQEKIPAAAEHLAIGLDLGKYWSHWVVMAAMPGGGPHVVTYGQIEVHSRTLGLERGLMACLREFHDMVEHGWARADGTMWVPDRAVIDSGYQGDTQTVYQFVNEVGGGRYWAADGRGEAQDGHQGYKHPTQLSNKILLLGEQYYVEMTPNGMLLVMDANHWKSWVHNRLFTPMGNAGAMTLFAGDGVTHVAYAKHLTAEREMTLYKPGKGQITVWDRVHKANHKLDATYMASIGLHMAGNRLLEQKPIIVEAKPHKVQEITPFVRPTTRSETSGGWIRRSRNNAET